MPKLCNILKIILDTCLLLINTHLKKLSGFAVLSFIFFKQSSNTVPGSPLAILPHMRGDRSVSQVNRLSGKHPLQFGSYVQTWRPRCWRLQVGLYRHLFHYLKERSFKLYFAIKVAVHTIAFSCIALSKLHISVCTIFVCFCASCHRFLFFVVIRTNRSVHKSYFIKKKKKQLWISFTFLKIFRMRICSAKPYKLKRLNVLVY